VLHREVIVAVAVDDRSVDWGEKAVEVPDNSDPASTIHRAYVANFMTRKSGKLMMGDVSLAEKVSQSRQQ
jgi:hypothetical protein